jgi:hypothetical protein
MNSPSFIGFFLTPEGDPSIRRLIGFMMAVFYLIGKTALFYIGVKNVLTNFVELDASVNDIGKLSLAFLGLAAIDSVANLFKKTK